MEEQEISITRSCEYSKSPKNSTNIQKFRKNLGENETKSFLSANTSMDIEIDTTFEGDQYNQESNILSEKSWLSKEFLVQFGIIYVGT